MGGPVNPFAPQANPLNPYAPNPFAGAKAPKGMVWTPTGLQPKPPKGMMWTPNGLAPKPPKGPKIK